jgi:hypothetical protein
MTKNEVKTELLMFMTQKLDNDYCTLGDEIIAARQSLEDTENQHLRFIGSLSSLPARLEEMKKLAECAIAVAKIKMAE